jgi:hypothetical protein
MGFAGSLSSAVFGTVSRAPSRIRSAADSSCLLRCMEHSLHLAAGHFISVIGPTPATKVLKKVRGLNLEATLGDDSGDEGDNEDVEFDVADTLGKALALVQQVIGPLVVYDVSMLHTNERQQIRKSPQARAFFKQTCHEAGVPELELVQFVRTRWASLFAFLDRMLTLQKVGDCQLCQKAAECLPGCQPLHPIGRH